MRSSRSVILLLSQSVAAAFLIGCQPPPKPAPPPPAPTVASQEQAQQMTVDLNSFGTAHIGRVNTISADDQLAAITGISDKDVKLGDVISIVDGISGKVVANGTITYVHLDKDTNTPAIVVKYDLSPEAGRAPIKGDLAVTQLPPK